jgi:hypothetical protein
MSCMILPALAPIRSRWHNLFEATHRFCGWAVIFSLIAHLCVLHARPQGLPARNFQVVWAVSGMTIALVVMIFYHWFLIRPHRASLECPSAALTVARLPGTVVAGTFVRVSTSPLLEWHAFSCALPDAASVEAGEPKFAILMAGAGDWTKRLAASVADGSAPAKLWVRRVRPPGFMYSIKSYRRAGLRVVAVATGAGIAPVLPHIVESAQLIHVVWIGRDHRRSYGSQICEVLFGLPEVTIFDSGVSGRPDFQVALAAYVSFQASALFVVSNDAFTKICMSESAKRGIPCFGATRDS